MVTLVTTGVALAGDVPAPPPPPLGGWESETPAVRDVVDPPTRDAVAYTQNHDWSVVEPVNPGAVVPPVRFMPQEGTREIGVDAVGLEETREIGVDAIGLEKTPTEVGPGGGRIVRSYFTPCEPTPRRGACCDPCDPCCCGSPWMIGLYASSAVFEDPTGILGEPVPAGVNPFNFGANTYDPVGGARLRVMHRRGCEDAFEFRGTFYGKATAESRQTGQFAFSNPAGVSPVASATVFNESLVWGFDINYWRTLRKTSRWHTRIGSGFRYTRIDEKAEVRDWAGNPNLQRSFIGAEARNALFAAQLMAGARFRVSSRFELMADAKVLGGVLTSTVDITEDSILSGGSKVASKDNNEFGWGVEGTVEARFRIGSRLWIRGSAEVLFIDGVQGATDSFDFARASTGAVQARTLTSDRVISTLFLGLDLDL